MPDLLVPLYNPGRISIADKSGEYVIRRVLAAERHVVCDWIEQHFNKSWASEAAIAAGRVPVSLFVAVQRNTVLGFACYDATAKGFFGPAGVAPDVRGRGIGRHLVTVTLQAMYEAGYAYAIIGGVGDKAGFYSAFLNTFEIPGSDPGIYRDMLR